MANWEVSSFIIACVLILVAGAISLKLRFPSAILEIFFGALAGTLGITVNRELEVLATIGVILLMFIAGTEVNVSLLRLNYLQCLVVGTSSFLAPLVTMTLILITIGFDLMSSLLISTALSTTSVAVVYALLDQSNLRGTKTGVLILTSAMIVDILSMAFLSIVFVGTSILVVLYILLMLFLIYLPRIFRRITKLGSDFEIKFIFMILIVLALLSEFVGVHSILTAFILGIFVSETFKEHKILEHKIRGLAFAFLIPFFFFVAGLYINLSTIQEYLFLIVLFVTAPLILKYIFTALPLNFIAKVKSSKLPTVFAARLTLSTIAAVVGLELSIIEVNVYSAILVSALVSAIAVAVLMHRLPYEEASLYEFE